MEQLKNIIEEIVEDLNIEFDLLYFVKNRNVNPFYTSSYNYIKFTITGWPGTILLDCYVIHNNLNILIELPEDTTRSCDVIDIIWNFLYDVYDNGLLNHQLHSPCGRLCCTFCLDNKLADAIIARRRPAGKSARKTK